MSDFDIGKVEVDSEFILYKNAWISGSPPHLHEKLSLKRCKWLLNQGGYFLRNEYDFDCGTITSFWYIIKDSFGGIEELSTKTRNQIRKALKTYDIRLITSEEMLCLGYPVFEQALKNYKTRADIITEKQFQKRIKDNEECDCIHYWGCFEKCSGKMVALSINTYKNNYCAYNTLKALPQCLHNSTYPYYGLIFEMNRYYLSILGLRYVSDGARSITGHSNIQQFLEEKFGFRKAYCQLQVVYKWWVMIIVYLLYPFRSRMLHPKFKAILNMEAMRRNQL